jgi:methionyl-tRNA formyltransferase
VQGFLTIFKKESCVKILEMAINVVFMGSPEFAIPILKALAGHYHLVGIVTKSDKPAGRGQVLTPPPVKKLAVELKLPYIQPKRLREPEAMEQLKIWQPDLIVVAAFGQILKPEVLDLPPLGCINVHASLLPRWRGVAPIQAAILNGDNTTGVTIMRIDPGVDTGPFLSQRSIPIQPNDTAGTLSERLSILGAKLLTTALPGYINGESVLQPQDENLATQAPMLKKEDGKLDFGLSAEVLERKVRAFNPWPGSFTFLEDQLFKIHRAHIYQLDGAEPGKRYIVEGWPALGTARGLLVLDVVQPASKKPMAGDLFLRGARTWGH